MNSCYILGNPISGIKFYKKEGNLLVPIHSCFFKNLNSELITLKEKYDIQDFIVIPANKKYSEKIQQIIQTIEEED